MASPNAFYSVQPAFTGGEISGDVASRIDLDKYQVALLQAENAIVRPYGAVRKRSGFLYCGTCKYPDRKTILVKFNFTVTISYMLEFGDRYIRIWRNGTYLGIEIETPYEAGDLSRLRFVQSVDVLYIASGKYPVKKLTRYSEDDWTFTDISWQQVPYGDLNLDEWNYITPSATAGNITLTAVGNTWNADNVGDWIKLEQNVPGVSAGCSLNAGKSEDNESLNGSVSGYIHVDKTWSVNSQGTWIGTVILDISYDNGATWSQLGLYVDSQAFVGPQNGTVESPALIRIRASIMRGSMTLTAAGNDWIQLEQSGKSVATHESTSSSIRVGEMWKVICHGTWTGTVTVYISYDNGATWLQLRQYTSSDDYNPTESGTVEEPALIRVHVSIASGKCNADISAYPYTHTGYARITGIQSSTVANAVVVKALGNTSRTNNWYLSCWGKSHGYPCCATFFQDRLCFAASEQYPQRIWMSRSGDYENFSVDKESGTVTDDSAISVDLLSLRPYRITHMDAGNDLIILTEGNEWTISGTETVTPTSITPRLQQNYGCNDAEPVRVGNRLVYVQRRGSIVRDMAYAYDTDSYGGYDLTLLAKHLISNKEIIDSSFAQEPDSIIYFVRSDGVLLCLTYIMEQKVYGWSHIVTDGRVESVLATQQGNNDIVYAVIARRINGREVRYIERLDLDSDSENQQDYVMLDCSARAHFDSPVQTITGADWLEGREVLVMGDGYLYEPKTVKNGTIELEQPVSDVVIGLPYTMILEQPNFNTTVSGLGNIQGMEQTVNTAVLRLSKSFGGEIGPNEDTLHDIVYDVGAMNLGEPCLYTGDKRVTIPSGGFNKNGRIYIKHSVPYPFTLLSIVRGVTLGGTGL